MLLQRKASQVYYRLRPGRGKLHAWRAIVDGSLNRCDDTRWRDWQSDAQYTHVGRGI